MITRLIVKIFAACVEIFAILIVLGGALSGAALAPLLGLHPVLGGALGFAIAVGITAILFSLTTLAEERNALLKALLKKLT